MMPKFLVEDHVIVKRFYEVEATDRRHAIAVAADGKEPDREELVQTENACVSEIADNLIQCRMCPAKIDPEKDPDHLVDDFWAEGGDASLCVECRGTCLEAQE
jgi:hypothetical protein